MPATNSEPLLEAVGLTRSFGGVVALENYSIRVRPGDLIGLIGPNGAGKTTVFNLLSGVLSPDGGRIFWRGADVTDRPTHIIARLGLARTFQNIRLFPDLSVIEKIRKFALIGEDFTIENDMLTPKMSLKRRVVMDRYGDTLESLYG